MASGEDDDPSDSNSAVALAQAGLGCFPQTLRTRTRPWPVCRTECGVVLASVGPTPSREGPERQRLQPPRRRSRVVGESLRRPRSLRRRPGCHAIRAIGWSRPIRLAGGIADTPVLTKDSVGGDAATVDASVRALSVAHRAWARWSGRRSHPRNWTAVTSLTSAGCNLPTQRDTGAIEPFLMAAPRSRIARYSLSLPKVALRRQVVCAVFGGPGLASANTTQGAPGPCAKYQETIFR